MDFLIQELTNKDLIYELFVEVNAKDKVFVLSRFIVQIVIKEINLHKQYAYRSIIAMLGAFL